LSESFALPSKGSQLRRLSGLKHLSTLAESGQAHQFIEDFTEAIYRELGAASPETITQVVRNILGLN
jgi:hypothetical protein